MAVALFSSAATASEIIITVAGPTSGPHSDRTTQMLAGARRAASKINGDGGIKGALVRIDTVDDGCSADIAASVATALASRKVDLVIGHPCAAAASAAAKVYASAQTLFIATGTRHSAQPIGASGTTVFRLSGRDNLQGAEAATYLADQHNGQTIAIVHDRTRASKYLADAAADTLKKRAMPEPITATVIGGDKDFPLLTAKLKTAAAIFYAGYPLEAGILYTQLRKAGSTATFLMSDRGGAVEFTDTFGRSVEGVHVMRPRFGLHPALDPKSSALSVDAQIAEADNALAAAAVAVYGAAANAADAVNPATVAHELSARVHATAEGTVAFDENGNAMRPSYDTYKWTGEIWERDVIAPLNR